MVTNIKLGPEGGPFVELDEDTGDFIIRVPNDSVDFDLSELSNISNLIANSAEIDGNTSPYAQDPHDVGGAQHAADTLANLNSKVSDATLDDTNDTREPEAHSGTHESGGTDEVNVAGLPGELADPQPSQTQDDGTDVVASPTLNFANALNVTDNAGTAQVDVDTGALDANIPDWSQDGNSPTTVTNQSSVTYTLASEYDTFKVFVYTSDSSDSAFLSVQVNGDTGSNYTYITVFASNETGQTEVPIASTGIPANDVTEFVMSGRWGGQWRYGQARPMGNDASTGAQNGVNTNVTSPLTQFTVNTGNTMDEITVEVFGRDTP